jgi:hypothetical protein
MGLVCGLLNRHDEAFRLVRQLAMAGVVKTFSKATASWRLSLSASFFVIIVIIVLVRFNIRLRLVLVAL